MLTINKRFQELLPPLREAEYARLEASIKSDGVRDPIVVWNGVIVDGHNRYDIAQKHGIAFQTIEKTFVDEEEACLWIVSNQSARRNLSKSQLAMIAVRLATLPKGANQHTEFSVCSQSHIAERFGISVDSIQQAKRVCSDGAAELIEAMKMGIIPVGEGSKLTRLPGDSQREIVETIVTGKAASVPEAIRVKKKAKREAEIDEMRKQVVTMPTGNFSCIVIDPPWNYGAKYCPDYYRGANPYPEMTREELINMPIVSADDCIMFLWTTQRFIWDAKELLDHWGFKYRSTIIWDKESMGLGTFLRQQCEFCLIGLKGKPLLNNPHNIRDIIRERGREHSRKPEAFYELVNTLCPGSKVEYFARQQRAGFACFGNDTEKFQNGDDLT